jgi:threonine dehydrogenase-like Zn-dependent dehydrogenase
MRAAVLEGPRSLVVTDVPDPALTGPDGAIVRVERTAICGSDLHLYDGELPAAGVRLGHEFVGVVDEVGPDVRTVRAGDRVLVSAVVGCGHCIACLARDPGLCRTNGLAIFGTGPDLHGGQAEAVAVPAADAFVLPIPEGVTTEQAVLLTDILPTGYVGAQRADITPGSDVAVIGLGPVGIYALQCAQLYSPGRLFAVDVVPDRLARAERLGAEPIDGRDAAAQIMERTGGRGVDSVVEAVGADATINMALEVIGAGGTVSVIGVSTNFAYPMMLPLLIIKRITFRISLCSVPSVWDPLLRLIAGGRLVPEDVFTHHLGLSQTADAYRMIDERADGVLKVLLDPSR